MTTIRTFTEGLLRLLSLRPDFYNWPRLEAQVQKVLNSRYGKAYFDLLPDEKMDDYHEEHADVYADLLEELLALFYVRGQEPDVLAGAMLLFDEQLPTIAY